MMYCMHIFLKIVLSIEFFCCATTAFNISALLFFSTVEREKREG